MAALDALGIVPPNMHAICFIQTKLYSPHLSLGIKFLGKIIHIHSIGGTVLTKHRACSLQVSQHLLRALKQ